MSRTVICCPRCGSGDTARLADWMHRCRACRQDFDEAESRAGRINPDKPAPVVEVSKFEPDVQERQKAEALAAISQMMADFKAKHPVEAAWQDLSSCIMFRENKDSLISALVVAVKQTERQRFREIVAACAIPGHAVGMAIVENILNKLEESEKP